MKTTIITYGSLLVVLLLCTGMLRAQADDAAADIKKVRGQFAERRYSVSLTYRLYDTYTALQPSETQVIDVSLWDLMVNMKNPHFHMIRNKEYYLYVNPDEKVLMLNSVKQYADELDRLKSVEQMVNIDTLVRMYRKVEPLKAPSGIRSYRLHMPDNMPYAYVDLNISSAGMLAKVVIYYRKGIDDLYGNAFAESKDTRLPRLELTFTNYRKIAVPDPGVFSINHYIVKKGKQFKAAPAYEHYQLINNTY